MPEQVRHSLDVNARLKPARASRMTQSVDDTLDAGAYDVIDLPEGQYEVDGGPVAALGRSVEGRFYSAADWQRARLELWFAHTVMTAGPVPSANQWSAVQRGLDELLVSPAVKRRAGIELRREGVDVDEVAAGEMVGKYRQVLKSV